MILNETESYEIDTIILNISWTSRFGFWWSEENLYVFSGNIFPEYNSKKENFYDFLPPKKSWNILPPKSEFLPKVDLSGNSISEIVAPKEADENCPVVKDQHW